MSYTNYDFPHTHFYDTDLRELIAMYQKLTSEYGGLVAWMNEHKGEYIGLLAKVEALQKEVKNIESEIDTRFANMETKLSEEIFEQFNAIKTALLNQLAEMDNKLLEMQVYLDDNIIYQNGVIQANRIYIQNYVDERLEEFINTFPDLHTVYVLNPIKGRITDIQEAINDLYELGRNSALTAYGYDIRGLTAQEYDNLELTAIEYDLYGLELINSAGYDYFDIFHYMTDPFTGQRVRLEVVINELASLHKDDSLTATEYDTLDIDASYYDGLDLSAYEYDWHGKTLVA